MAALGVEKVGGCSQSLRGALKIKGPLLKAVEGEPEEKGVVSSENKMIKQISKNVQRCKEGSQGRGGKRPWWSQVMGT